MSLVLGLGLGLSGSLSGLGLGVFGASASGPPRLSYSEKVLNSFRSVPWNHTYIYIGNAVKRPLPPLLPEHFLNVSPWNTEALFRSPEMKGLGLGFGARGSGS